MSDLSRSVVDAAADAIRAVTPAEHLVTVTDPASGTAERGQREARAAMAAGLEALAKRAHWLKPEGSDGFVTAREVNEALRRLAVEVREGI